MARKVFATAGVHLVHEHPVRDRQGCIVASLDLADPDARVGVECQSWRHHGTPGQAYADVRRKRVLRRLGWEVVEVWWWDLERPDEVVDELTAVLHRRRARNRPETR